MHFVCGYSRILKPRNYNIRSDIGDISLRRIAYENINGEGGGLVTRLFLQRKYQPRYREKILFLINSDPFATAVDSQMRAINTLDGFQY